MFKVEELHRSYGANKVLQGVSFELQKGDLCLLLGANGSGKTTLLRACAGLSKPDSGQLTSLTFSQLGYKGHQLNLYGALTVQENIILSSSLARLKSDPHTTLAEWQLSKVRDRRVTELSAGTQNRVALCRALLHKPPFIFLDEPSSSLDDQAVANLLERLASLAADATILIATHDVARFRPQATRILVLAAGRIAADSRASSITEALDFYARVNR